MRIELLPGKPSKDIPNAFVLRPKIKKNKCAPPHPEPLEIDFIYNRGPDFFMDLMNTAKSLGIIRFAGSATKKGEDTIAGGGKAGFYVYLSENPDFVTALVKECSDAARNTRRPADDEQSDSD
jgi:hypothetical protein